MALLNRPGIGADTARAHRGPVDLTVLVDTRLASSARLGEAAPRGRVGVTAILDTYTGH